MIGINRIQLDTFEQQNQAIIKRLNECGDQMETKFYEDVATMYEYSNHGTGKQINLSVVPDEVDSDAQIDGRNGDQVADGSNAEQNDEESDE